MRVELVIYAGFIVLLLLSVRALHHPDLDVQMVLLCRSLIDAATVHSASVPLPCGVEEGVVSYGDAEIEITSTSHGVVVRGEHCPAP